jgi:ribokinase
MVKKQLAPTRLQDQPKVVCLGSLNMDLVIQVQAAPLEGETVEGQSIRYLPGGKGANQAVSCARQGARVCLLGRVGNDPYGNTLREALRQDSIATDGVQIDPSEPTGVAMVLVDTGGLNRIVVIPGANGQLQLDEGQLRQELGDAQFLVMQFEVGMAQVLHAAKVAHQLGCKVVLNPSPAKALPEELWAWVDTLIVNESEAYFLTGLRPDADPQIAAEVGRRLHSKGVANVIVTLGAQGAVATDSKRSTLQVLVVDTTAAGDTFLGAVTVALARNQSLTASVALGISAASLCVQTLGAQPSIPTYDQVLQISAPHWVCL